MSARSADVYKRQAFPYVEIAKEYEAAGAAAVSVLTEPHFFLGSDAYLREIRQAVQIPLLRKDFTIDEYQIYEAKTLGADAVLLICSLLGENQLASYLALAHSLGMDALVEAHDCGEIQCALRAGADIIGVNNRNLRDFSVNVQNSLALQMCIRDSCKSVHRRMFSANALDKCTGGNEPL